MLTAPRGGKINQEPPPPPLPPLSNLVSPPAAPPHLVNIQPHREPNTEILFMLDFPSTADATRGTMGRSRTFQVIS